MVPAFVLGALDADEAARTESHLASCKQCARVLQEYRHVADALALSVPVVEPPPEFKGMTLRGAVEQDAREKRREPAHAPWPWWARLGFTPLLVGAVLAVVLVAAIWDLEQTAGIKQQLAAQQSFMTLIAYAQGNALTIRGTSAAPLAVGKLYADSDSSVAALVTVNLPPPNPGKVYQAWLTSADGRQVSGGTFSVNGEGDGWLLVRAPQQLGSYKQVSVTVEPGGGSSSPTTEPLLTAELTAP